VLLPDGPGVKPFLKLPCPVGVQGVTQPVRRHDRAPAGAALRLVEHQALADQALHRAPYGQRASLEVDVLPTERESLTLTEAQRECDGPSGLVAQPPGSGQERPSLRRAERHDLLPA